MSKGARRARVGRPARTCPASPGRGKATLRLCRLEKVGTVDADHVALAQRTGPAGASSCTLPGPFSEGLSSGASCWGSVSTDCPKRARLHEESSKKTILS